MCEQDDAGNCIGGSYAWFTGARGYDIETHPDPENPGDGSNFRIWVPFEVWDMEHPDGPQQIDIDVYDRIQNTGADDAVLTLKNNFFLAYQVLVAMNLSNLY